MHVFLRVRDRCKSCLARVWLERQHRANPTQNVRAKRLSCQERALAAGPNKLVASPRAGGRDGLLARLGFGKATLRTERTTRRR